MDVNPNKFDVRVTKKFQTQLNLTDKDQESELKHLANEPDTSFVTITGGYLEDVEAKTPPTSPSQLG